MNTFKAANGEEVASIFEDSIRSPKSALFSSDGKKLYINSLEGHQTTVLDWPTLRRLKLIDHRFTAQHSKLFQTNEAELLGYRFPPDRLDIENIFRGKPVEMTLSHEGRYLWVTYYRRDYDSSAQAPSGVAIIDTTTDRIVRVMATGPIPKFVTISPDGRMAAITHWGDNTIGIIDISGQDASTFQYQNLLTVESKLSQSGLEGTDRDVTCGFCLRGTVFSKDSRYLFVARMGTGGIAGFDLNEKKYLGTSLNVKSTPRHLVLSPDGQKLISSSNSTGYVTVFSVEKLIEDLTGANGRRINGRPGQEVYVGRGARTIEISPDGDYIFAAISNDSKLVAVRMKDLKVAAEINLDSFPVGLALSHDGEFAVVTSQGKPGLGGGNTVNIVKIKKK